MSAQPDTSTSTDPADDVPPDIDSYAIDIPAAFVEAFPGTTIPEKLRAAERAPSTTGASERGACCRCGSVRVHKKTGYDDQIGDERPYRCTNCGAHVEELVAPAVGARDDEQTGLEVFTNE